MKVVGSRLRYHVNLTTGLSAVFGVVQGAVDAILLDRIFGDLQSGLRFLRLLLNAASVHAVETENYYRPERGPAKRIVRWSPPPSSWAKGASNVNSAQSRPLTGKFSIWSWRMTAAAGAVLRSAGSFEAFTSTRSETLPSARRTSSVCVSPTSNSTSSMSFVVNPSRETSTVYRPTAIPGKR